MKRSLVIALVVLAAVALVVAGLVRARTTEARPRPGAEAAPVRVAAPTRGTIAQFLDITGSLEARRRADVASKLSGKVARVAVEEGDRVAAGQELVVLDQEDYRAQVAQAEAAVEAARASVGAAQARLASVRAGARPQELRQAEEAVRQAKASLDNATATHSRTADLLRQGAVPQQQMDAAQLQLDVARAQHESALQQLNLTREGARREDIRAAEQQVRQAQAAEAQARAALQLARVNLQSTVVRSPIAGIIAKRHVEPGEALGMASLTVATVVDNRETYMRGEVSETDLRLVHPGQTVVVTVDALPGRRFPGQVIDVLPSADLRSRAFSARLRVPNLGGELREGMFARARVALARRTDALLVPRIAVLGEEGSYRVFVVHQGSAEQRAVTLGAVQGDLVEVRQGLGGDERIVVEGHRSLRNGARVTALEEERD